jgi:hypothetical protein
MLDASSFSTLHKSLGYLTKTMLLISSVQHAAWLWRAALAQKFSKFGQGRRRGGLCASSTPVDRDALKCTLHVASRSCIELIGIFVNSLWSSSRLRESLRWASQSSLTCFATNIAPQSAKHASAAHRAASLSHTTSSRRLDHELLQASSRPEPQGASAVYCRCTRLHDKWVPYRPYSVDIPYRGLDVSIQAAQWPKGARWRNHLADSVPCRNSRSCKRDQQSCIRTCVHGRYSLSRPACSWQP